MMLSKFAVTVLLLVVVRSNVVVAQLTSEFPSITQGRVLGSATVPYTAAEWDYGAFLYREQARAYQSPTVLTFPADSIRAALSTQVTQWIATLEAGEIRGLQMDPYGKLLIASDRIEAARKMFAERLASPGMTTADSAFTLFTALQAFADAEVPARIPVAEEYMKQLDALGDAANYWKYQGHEALAMTHFVAGNQSALVSHATRAIGIVPKLFFGSRVQFYISRSGHNMYLALVDALRSAPDGAARVAEMDRHILAAALPSSDLIAVDPEVQWQGQNYQATIQVIMRLAAMLGTPAPTVRATSWLNVSDTTTHEMPLNDGTIRLVGMGTYGATLYRLPAFNRILAKIGAVSNGGNQVNAVFLVGTQGYLGTRFVTPEEESNYLENYFTKTRPTKIPIAIWAGKKEQTRDGGMRPTVSPTIKAFKAPFPQSMVVIVDGQGRIRRLFLEFGRNEEAQAVAVIRNLLSNK